MASRPVKPPCPAAVGRRVAGRRARPRRRAGRCRSRGGGRRATRGAGAAAWPRGRRAGEGAQLLDLVGSLLERARAHLGGLAERPDGGARGLGERPEEGEERVQVGRRARARRAAAGSARRPGPRGAPWWASARRGSRAAWRRSGAAPRAAWRRSRRSRPASTMKRDTSSLRASSWATTVSESLMKFSITRFWLPRIFSTLLVSRRPGCARLSTSWRSSGRPARPVPSSLMIEPQPLPVGRRRMLLTRSCGMVDAGAARPGSWRRPRASCSSSRAGSPRSTRRSATAA